MTDKEKLFAVMAGFHWATKVTRDKIAYELQLTYSMRQDVAYLLIDNYIQDGTLLPSNGGYMINSPEFDLLPAAKSSGGINWTMWGVILGVPVLIISCITFYIDKIKVNHTQHSQDTTKQYNNTKK